MLKSRPQHLSTSSMPKLCLTKHCLSCSAGAYAGMLSDYYQLRGSESDFTCNAEPHTEAPSHLSDSQMASTELVPSQAQTNLQRPHCLQGQEEAAEDEDITDFFATASRAGLPISGDKLQPWRKLRRASCVRESPPGDGTMFVLCGVKFVSGMNHSNMLGI